MPCRFLKNMLFLSDIHLLRSTKLSFMIDVK